jgi:hypothetical protein
MLQEELRELRQALEAGLGGKGRRDHLLGEDRARRLDRRELELLLRAEMGEEPALAHPDCLGEPADREPGDSLDGCELRRLVEDRVSAPLSVAPSFPHTNRRLCHLLES